MFYLASAPENAGFMTGATLNINGGLYPVIRRILRRIKTGASGRLFYGYNVALH